MVQGGSAARLTSAPPVVNAPRVRLLHGDLLQVFEELRVVRSSSEHERGLAGSALAVRVGAVPRERLRRLNMRAAACTIRPRYTPTRRCPAPAWRRRKRISTS